MVYTEIFNPDFVSVSVVELHETTDDWTLLIQQAPYNKHPHLIQMPFFPPMPKQPKIKSNQIKFPLIMLLWWEKGHVNKYYDSFINETSKVLPGNTGSAWYPTITSYSNIFYKDKAHLNSLRQKSLYKHKIQRSFSLAL